MQGEGVTVAVAWEVDFFGKPASHFQAAPSTHPVPLYIHISVCLWEDHSQASAHTDSGRGQDQLWKEILGTSNYVKGSGAGLCKFSVGTCP